LELVAERDALLDHLNERFDAIDSRLAELGQSFDVLQSAVDGYASSLSRLAYWTALAHA